MRLKLHPGQQRAWRSSKRFVLVLAGTQGGKSVFGPHWLYREIRRRGPGDYLVVTPTYPLLIKKALPEFLRVFSVLMRLGEYRHQQKVFAFGRYGHAVTHPGLSFAPTQVFFGHASDPESLESATAKAAWLDEAGQKKFRLASWEAIQRRLSIHRGRALITTTPYDLGWLKQKLFDPWQQAKQQHPDIDVVRFDSTQNPAFPREEFERAMRELPRWKFDLFYRALFTRPAGLIYDSFVASGPGCHVVPRFRIPESWRRLVGVDFGPTNTAAVFYAEEQDINGKPTKRLFAYREYHPGKRDPAEHAAALRENEPRLPLFVGGSTTEHEWRRNFGKAGIPILAPPVTDVEVGIDTVYACHARGEILVFDDMSEYLEQKATYSRELLDDGTVTEKIADKAMYHLLDAERYLITHQRWGRKLTVGV